LDRVASLAFLRIHSYTHEPTQSRLSVTPAPPSLYPRAMIHRTRPWGGGSRSDSALTIVSTFLYYDFMERRWGIREFEWDEANEGHIGRHGVSPSEVEEVFSGRIRIRRSRFGRYLVLGRTAQGRYLVVVIEKLGGGWARAVTARDMSPAERRLYARRK